MAAPNLVWNSLGLTELHADRNVFENLEIDELIKRGLSKHEDGEYRESISIFSKALAHCQSQKHVCATIYQYRADTYLQQNEYTQALNDVNDSFRFSNNSLEIHVIAGKALTAYGNYDGAYIEYIRAYSRAVLFEKWRIVEVFQEFTTFFGHLPENLRNTFMTRTRLYMGEHANNWLSVCHHNVTKKDWKKAKMAYLQFKEYQLRPLESMKFDLKPFCNIREIKGNCWIADIIFHLIKCGSDKTELSLEEGDTYLHAAVRISVVSGHPQLIKYLVENESEAEVVSKPMVDSHGNTLLHVATKERNVYKKDRNEVIAIVLEYGVDPDIRDTNGRLAISYLSDDKSKNLIRTFLKAKEIKEKSNTQDVRVMTRNKIPTGKTRRKKKKAEERKIDSTCEKCQQIYNEAVSLLQKNKLDGLQLYIKLFNIDHSNVQHSRLVQDALKEFVEYIEKLNETDIHACMEGLCEGKVFLVIERIATFQKWTLLDVIHKHLKHRVDDKALIELCSKFSLDSYSKNISQTEEEVNIRIVNNLLDCGWCLGKDNARIFMQTAIDFKQFKFAVELFNHGIDLSFLTIYKGDTPIHAAIEIAMQEKQPSFLKGLLGKFKSDEKSYPYLNPEQLDMDGHNVLHLVTKSSDSDLVMQLTQILKEMGISANNHNVDINASKIGNLNAQSKPMESKGHSEIAHTSSSLSSRNKSSSIPSENPEQIKRRINDLMTSLPCNIQDTPIQKQANDKNIEVKMIDKQEHNVNTFKHEIPLKTVAKGVCTEVDYPPNKHNKARNKTLEDIATSVCFASKKDDSFDNDKKLEAMDKKDVDFSDLPPLESNEDIIEKTEHNTDVDVDFTTCKEDENISDKADDEYDSLDQESSFEDLTWEVEYTDKVRQSLENKHIEPQLKLKMLRIIRRLADGDWQNNFCKRLKIGPHNFDLFEAKLSKGSRIIWEKAINFSPRYNDNAACSLNDTNDNATEVQEDRIYTEVIRIWDIVIDHDKIKRSVEHIINAHLRGEKSLIQRKLKGLKTNDERRKGNYPLLFTSNCKPDFISGTDKVQERQHFPPASSNKTDYNILKFYTWDGALERYFLHGGKNNIEFPFKVTEKEDAIIRLNDKGPILLLGRSGTGKTTCCLFRLWNEYKIHLPQVEKNIDEREEEQSEGNRESCENDEKQGAAYEQFHQLFLTKNYVLAAEVKKTFGGFLDTYDTKQNSISQEHEKPVPYRFEDLTNSSFPLFLTSRQFLCTLDASIENPYFSRKEDGSLKYPVEGWADEEEFTALDILDFDSSDEDTADGDDFYPDVSRERQQKSYGDIKKEVTFETFENLIWPKLEHKSGGHRYNPSLIWTEIMSFIKGSYESLYTKRGYISKEEYLKIGTKRAPNFAGEREEVYKIFELYEHKKRQLHMFDETDVVFDIFRRLDGLDSCPITLHQVYVDEAQDFTQAELFLLITLCRDPNNMFLTGDTAQTIMRGISFRFEDLKGLFHHVKQVVEGKKRQSQSSKTQCLTVNVPKRVHKLIYNYRSHSGIVSMAASVLDIMSYFFRESFDLLDPDQGLLPGPEPILLESCTFSDLAVMLSGHKRETPTIEFGAHQVILVYDEDARKSLPEELSCGLVLTIYESKGLEFDDVLLYNFFKDSKASKEWRVVTQYLDELASGDINIASQQSGVCVSIDTDVLSSQNRPRPLNFDPCQHKILNFELKLLYTALTRARVNVWIFDENEDLEETRPMYEYFKARRVVKPIAMTDELADLSGVMFVDNSDSKEWLQQGDYFLKNRLYGIALKCYRKGGDGYKQALAKGHKLALMAWRKITTACDLKQMKTEFLLAAEKFLQCEHYLKAATCLRNVKEVDLATQLYEKLSLYEKAADLFRRHKQYEKCSKLYERHGYYHKAVSVLFENELYGLAFDIFERHADEKITQREETLRELTRVSRPNVSFTEDKIYKRAAEEFHKCDKLKSMNKAVSRFYLRRDMIEFYKKNGYISDAARELISIGEISEAVHINLIHGKFSDALEIAENSKDDEEIAKCLLLRSRDTISKTQNLEERDHRESIQNCVVKYVCERKCETQTNNTLEKDLKRALLLFRKLKDKESTGKVMLLQAKVYDDVEYVRSAEKEFTKFPSNKEGYVECCKALVPFLDKRNIYDWLLHFLLKGVDILFDVFRNLLFKAAKSELHDKAFRFYEMHFVTREGKPDLVAYPKTNPTCTKMLPEQKMSDIEAQGLNDMKCIHKIVMRLLKDSSRWTGFLKDTLLDQRSSTLDSLFEDSESTQSGNMVQECRDKLLQLVETNRLLAKYNFFTNKADKILLEYKHKGGNDALEKQIKALNFPVGAKENNKTCKFILKKFIKQPRHPLFVADETDTYIFENQFFRVVMERFLSQKFKNSYRSLKTGEPVEAVLKFQHELTKLEVQDRRTDLDHQLLCLEIYLTIALFYVAKDNSLQDKEFTFYIPNTYMTLLNFVESTLNTKFSILEIIPKLTPGEGDKLLNCVTGIAGVISNQMEKQVMKYKDKENKIMLLSRLIILINTMLCNGQLVSSECYKILAISACKIMKEYSTLKVDSQIPVRKTEQLTRIKDVAKVLEDFFTTRDFGESLQSIRWIPQECGLVFSASPIDIETMPTVAMLGFKCKTENSSDRMTTDIKAALLAEGDDRRSESISEKHNLVKGKTHEPKDYSEKSDNSKQEDEICFNEADFPALETNVCKSEEHFKQGKKKRIQLTNDPVSEEANKPKSSGGSLTDFTVNHNQEKNIKSSNSMVLNHTNLESTEIQHKDDNLKTLPMLHVDGVFREILENNYECGICGVPYENRGDDICDNNDERVKLLEESDVERDQITYDIRISNDVSVAKQNHEMEQTHLENSKVFEKFERAYNEDIKPIICRVNEVLKNSRFHSLDNNFIVAKHLENFKEEIQRLTDYNDRLQTNIIEVLRTRTWVNGIESMQSIADVLQKDFDLVKSYVTNSADEILEKPMSLAIDMEQNVVKQPAPNMHENDFEEVALGPTFKRKKYISRKARRDKKKHLVKN